MTAEPTEYDKRQDERIKNLEENLEISKKDDSNGKVDQGWMMDDILLKYEPVDGETGVNYKFKSGNENRYQLVAKLNKCYLNLAQVGYFKIEKVDDDHEEISGKNRGGRHSDSVKNEASCYIQGLGYDSKVVSKYEQPHPNNHDLEHTTDKENPYGNSIVGKWVGIQNIIYFKDGKDHLETWVDLKAGEIDTNGKPGNEWVKFWHTDTEKFAGKCNAPSSDVLSYWRLDDIPDGHKQKNCTHKYCKIYEIEPPI